MWHVVTALTAYPIVLICDCVVPEAPPAHSGTNGVKKASFEDTLKAIQNDAVCAVFAAITELRPISLVLAIRTHRSTIPHTRQLRLRYEGDLSHGYGTILTFCHCASLLTNGSKLMYNSLNALERTTSNFEKIVTASGFKVSHIYTTRGASSGM